MLRLLPRLELGPDDSVLGIFGAKCCSYLQPGSASAGVTQGSGVMLHLHWLFIFFLVLQLLSWSALGLDGSVFGNSQCCIAAALSVQLLGGWHYLHQVTSMDEPAMKG